jgi:hypothetical protein
LKICTSLKKIEITLVNTFVLLFVGCFFNDPFDKLFISSNFQLVHVLHSNVIQQYDISDSLALVIGLKRKN